MEEENPQKVLRPFKICNNTREIRKGIVAVSLVELTSKVQEKFGVGSENRLFTIVLEEDGTEIDDEEYFATLDPHTSLMILNDNQKWMPAFPNFKVGNDQVDGTKSGELAGLVGRLKTNLCHLSLLNGPELELLSDMDPDSLADLTYPDKIFLDQLKEASGRFLSDRRKAEDAIELLKLYQEKEAAESETKAERY